MEVVWNKIVSLGKKILNYLKKLKLRAVIVILLLLIVLYGIWHCPGFREKRLSKNLKDDKGLKIQVKRIFFESPSQFSVIKGNKPVLIMMGNKFPLLPDQVLLEGKQSKYEDYTRFPYKQAEFIRRKDQLFIKLGNLSGKNDYDSWKINEVHGKLNKAIEIIIELRKLRPELVKNVNKDKKVRDRAVLLTRKLLLLTCSLKNQIWEICDDSKCVPTKRYLFHNWLIYAIMGGIYEEVGENLFIINDYKQELINSGITKDNVSKDFYVDAIGWYHRALASKGVFDRIPVDKKNQAVSFHFPNEDYDKGLKNKLFLYLAYCYLKIGREDEAYRNLKQWFAFKLNCSNKHYVDNEIITKKLSLNNGEKEVLRIYGLLSLYKCRLYISQRNTPELLCSKMFINQGIYGHYRKKGLSRLLPNPGKIDLNTTGGSSSKEIIINKVEVYMNVYSRYNRSVLDLNIIEDSRISSSNRVLSDYIVFYIPLVTEDGEILPTSIEGGVTCSNPNGRKKDKHDIEYGEYNGCKYLFSRSEGASNYSVESSKPKDVKFKCSLNIFLPNALKERNNITFEFLNRLGKTMLLKNDLDWNLLVFDLVEFQNNRMNDSRKKETLRRLMVVIKKLDMEKLLSPNKIDNSRREKITNKINGSPLFCREDIMDWPSLIKSLKDSRSKVEEHIYGSLGAESREAIVNADLQGDVGNNLKDLVVTDLNYIIRKRTFYNREVFKKVKTTGEVKKLLSKGYSKLEEDELQRLNRLLLESVYPKIIVKSQLDDLSRNRTTVCSLSEELLKKYSSHKTPKLIVYKQNQFNILHNGREISEFQLYNNVVKTDFCPPYGFLDKKRTLYGVFILMFFIVLTLIAAVLNYYQKSRILNQGMDKNLISVIVVLIIIALSVSTVYIFLSFNKQRQHLDEREPVQLSTVTNRYYWVIVIVCIFQLIHLGISVKNQVLLQEGGALSCNERFVIQLGIRFFALFLISCVWILLILNNRNLPETISFTSFIASIFLLAVFGISVFNLYVHIGKGRMVFLIFYMLCMAFLALVKYSESIFLGKNYLLSIGNLTIDSISPANLGLFFVVTAVVPFVFLLIIDFNNISIIEFIKELVNSISSQLNNKTGNALLEEISDADFLRNMNYLFHYCSQKLETAQALSLLLSMGGTVLAFFLAYLQLSKYIFIE